MKNIEKFTSIMTAMSTWKLLPEGRPPFDEWLMADADPMTRRASLLMKARNLLTELDRRFSLASLCHTERLALLHAVRAEEIIPTRRYELYPTPDAAQEGFTALCGSFPNCTGCPYYPGDRKAGEWNCKLRWLYDEPTDGEYRKVGAK